LIIDDPSVVDDDVNTSARSDDTLHGVVDGFHLCDVEPRDLAVTPRGANELERSTRFVFTPAIPDDHVGPF